MLLKTLQWNIGGAYIRNQDDLPEASSSYSNLNLEYIANIIKTFDPDIATFQETHSNADSTQVAYLAEKLSYPFFHNDTYDDSHIEKGQRLGQGILSKHTISNKSFTLYENPKLKIIRPSGEEWLSHDKGVSKFTIKVDKTPLSLKTSHAVPFKKFGADFLSEEMRHIRKDVTKKILPIYDLEILQGDFNYDNESLKPIFPELFKQGMEEYLTYAPTEYNKYRYDHVAFKGLTPIKLEIISDTLTDHCPLYCEFDLIQ